MRLFTGIALAPEAAAALAGIRQRFAASARELRWSAPESWHVTLQFLGGTDKTQFRCVTERLARIRAAAVPIGIAGLGFFERAGILFAGVPLTPELLDLQQQVTAATRGCEFIPESRSYYPHITLARLKGRTAALALQPLKKAVEQSRLTLGESFVATEFLLYESCPEPLGSTYEVRARFPLVH
jgi:2'-5' RNA ligase